MGVASIFMGVGAFLLMLGGVVLAWVPYLGAALSFTAPVLALAGIVVAGIAMSRAKQDGEVTSAPVAGLVINIIGFLFSILFALTCGLCNACLSAGAMNGRHLNRRSRFEFIDDAGVLVAPAPGTPPATQPATPNTTPTAPTAPTAPTPEQDPNAPPPAMPPPPIEPAPAAPSAAPTPP